MSVTRVRRGRLRDPVGRLPSAARKADGGEMVFRALRRSALDLAQRPWMATILASVFVAIAFGIESRAHPDVSCEVLYLAAAAYVAWCTRSAWHRTSFAAAAALAHVLAGLMRSPLESVGAHSIAWLVGAHMAVFLGATWLVAKVRSNMLLETQRATTDDLTGVASRRHFIAMLSAELTVLHDLGRPHGVAFIDLDRFREVNNHFGHERGDAVLAACAQAMQGAVRNGDLVGRIGGDEFAVLLRADDLEARRTAERIRDAVLAVAASQDLSSILGVSIGVVTCHLPDGPAPRRLLTRADRLMYEAKASGGNAIAFEALTDRSESVRIQA